MTMADLDLPAADAPPDFDWIDRVVDAARRSTAAETHPVEDRIGAHGSDGRNSALEFQFFALHL